MNHERAEGVSSVTAIHVDLAEQAVEFADGRGTLARVDFGALPVRFTDTRGGTGRPPDFIPVARAAAVETALAPVPHPPGHPANEPDTAPALPAEQHEVGEPPALCTLVG